MKGYIEGKGIGLEDEGRGPGPAKDCVNLLPSTAEALDALDIVGFVGKVNVDLQAMAWLALVLRYAPDDPKKFPHGKWATIQRIEDQLKDAAEHEAAKRGWAR